MRVFIGILLLLALVPPSHGTAGSDYTCAIYFSAEQARFRELELPKEIQEKLIGHPKLRVLGPDRSDSAVCNHPRLRSDCYQPDLMSEMARIMDVRYIVWLEVKEAGIRQSDRTLIPYLFRWHRRSFALAVQVFMFDSILSRTVLSEYFESKRSGPSSLSYLDFDPNNPSLFKKYSIVKGKFSEMEGELSEEIAKSIAEVTRER